MASVLIYDRTSQTVRNEAIYKENVMQFLYGTRIGFAVSELLARHRTILDLYAKWQERGNTDGRIKDFIQRYKIDVTEIEHPVEHYKRFDDFFTRRLKPNARPLALENHSLISPADGRVICLPLEGSTAVPVKGLSIPIQELIGPANDAQHFRNGDCLVCRLAPADYHRFCYIDDGRQEVITRIPGFYRAVSPLSLRHMKAVFTQNRRDVTIIKGENIGPFAHVDVGALAVGRIYQHNEGDAVVARGQEKGYFGFGGSTIILLFRGNSVVFDEDIIAYSKKGIETKVRLGERIGRVLD